MPSATLHFQSSVAEGMNKFKMLFLFTGIGRRVRGIRAVAEFHKVDGARALEGSADGGGPGGFQSLGAAVVGGEQALHKKEVRAVFQSKVCRHIG